MGRESFKNLSMFLTILAGDITDMSPAICMLNDMDKAELKEEAGKVLDLMDNYKEPVLPFANVTQEQIRKTYADLEEKYEFVVWSNSIAGSDEDCANYVRTDPDYFLGMSEDEVRSIALAYNADDRETIRKELADMDTDDILITGTLGRWNGPRPVSKIITNPSEIFSVFNGGDECTLYIKNGDLLAENVHHDGTDRFKFQIQTDGGYESIVPVMDRHFGWELTDKKGDDDDDKSGSITES